MNVVSFFSKCRSELLLSRYAVIAFAGSLYPAFFLSLFLQAQRKKGLTIRALDLMEIEESALISLFETSFLGTTTLYWLGDLSQLSLSSHKEWLRYFSSYKGPNVLMFFTSHSLEQQENERYCVVAVPEECDNELFKEIEETLQLPRTSGTHEFVDSVRAARSRLSPDSAALLLSYAPLVGTQSATFVAEWVDELVVGRESFFELSQYFFAKNGAQFFRRWSRLSRHTMPHFWIAFFSEQLYRAYAFIKYSHQHDETQARFMSMRLPFSFTRRDWKNISLAELKRAHQRLYALDFALKNGGSEVFLDHFFSLFFKNYFV